jgi:hypothetical protein
MALLTRPLRAWDRFWFAPRESSPLVVVRVGLAAVVLTWALTLAPDLVAFFSNQGILPHPSLETRRVGLLSVVDSPAAVWALYATLLISAAGLLAGVRVRVFGPLLWICVVSFQNRNPLIWNAGDTLLRLFVAYLALHALVVGNLGPRLGDLRLLAERRPLPPAPGWGLRLVQLQTTAVYLFAALDKLRGETWWEGTAVTRALSLVEFERFPLPEMVQTSAAIGALLTWGTLALEVMLPFLLWWRRTRLIAIALGVSMHLGFDYALRIGFFSWAMVVGCLSFLPPREPGTVSGSRRTKA